MIPNVPPPTGMSACACDSMGTCLAHELSPNRCNCNIAWASPTPRPVCPEHGSRLNGDDGLRWAYDRIGFGIEGVGRRVSVGREAAPGIIADAMGVRWSQSEYFSTPEVM